MDDILIAMMHNPNTMIEHLHGTEWSYINKFHHVNYFCMATIFGEIKPKGCLKSWTTRPVKCWERVLSSRNGHIKLGDIGVHWELIWDIAIRSVNSSSSASCQVCKGGYTGDYCGIYSRDNWQNTVDYRSNAILLCSLSFSLLGLYVQ